MKEKIRPNYSEVQSALYKLKALSESAEAHGLLCALFSGGAEMRVKAWIDSMLSGNFPEDGDIQKDQAMKVLELLYHSTKEQFESNYFDLELLLPNDDAPFYARIGALAMWCQSYLSGLGLVGVNLDKHKKGEIGEAITDLVKMSQLQFDEEEEGNEDDEKAYNELVEYTKVAVLLLHAEFSCQTK